MTADLTGKLPPGTRRIRIWTNLKIYWDQVLVDTTPDGAMPVDADRGARSRRRRSRSAATRARCPARRQPTSGTSSTTSASTGPYARHRGFYTKYGDVTPLLRRAEDHFVIFGSGDDVALDFDATTLPPLQAGLDARLRGLPRTAS